MKYGDHYSFLFILLNSISGVTLLPIWGQNLKTGLEKKWFSPLGLKFYLDLHLNTKIHALKTNQNKQLTTVNQVDLTFAQSYITVAVWTPKNFFSLLIHPQGSKGCQKITFLFYKWNCFPFALRLPQKAKTIKVEEKMSKITCFF